MNVLLWHVHGSWTTAFVHGAHRVLLPVLADRGPLGRGRAQTWNWPSNAVELSPEALRDEPIDVIIVQRAEEEDLARRWLGGRVPGRDVPLVWQEHNAPQGSINAMRHPAADRTDVTVVHVTPTNDLFWDCGRTETVVIEHGIVDPGHRFSGTEARAAVVVNEPLRRARVSGTDLLTRFAAAVPIDLFGMAASAAVAELEPSGRSADARMRGFDDLPQARLHAELAQRRVYLHPYRWTSLGLALIEAMHLGLPVVALAVTDAPDAIPADAGVVSNRLDRLSDALRCFVADPDLAAETGRRARAAALARFGLERFLGEWDVLLRRVVAQHHPPTGGVDPRPTGPGGPPSVIEHRLGVSAAPVEPGS